MENNEVKKEDTTTLPAGNYEVNASSTPIDPLVSTESITKVDPTKDAALKKILDELSKITPYTPQGTRQRKDRSGSYTISPRAAQKRIAKRKMAARSRRLARHK